jgi:hypothetical protein
MELGQCKSRFTIVPKRTNVLPTPVATNKAAGRDYNWGQDKFWACPGSKPKTLQLHLHLLRTWSEGRVPWVTWTWHQRHQDTTRTQEAHTYYEGPAHTHLRKLQTWMSNTTQVLTPSATNHNAFIFDLAPPCSYTMKLGTQHVFDCLICTNTQEMHIPI